MYVFLKNNLTYRIGVSFDFNMIESNLLNEKIFLEWNIS